jgi:large subunit ribosomal protein L4
LNLEGKKVGELELADAVFAAKVNPHLLHETVRWYLASQRAGTHKTKGRGEVSGSGRKLWRQKGTGRARVGSIRSSIWRKGGTVHGPQPRSYAYRLPRKMLLGALRSALSAKLADQKLAIVETWALESHKTKAFRQVLDRLSGDAHTVLLVETAANRNLELASRNLDGVKLVSPSALRPYDLMRHDRLMISKDAAVKLGTTLGPRGEAAPAADAKPTKAATPEVKAAPAKMPRAPRKKSPKKKGKE